MNGQIYYFHARQTPSSAAGWAAGLDGPVQAAAAAAASRMMIIRKSVSHSLWILLRIVTD